MPRFSSTDPCLTVAPNVPTHPAPALWHRGARAAWVRCTHRDGELSEEIAATPEITMRPHTEVVGAHGSGLLEALGLRDRRAGEVETITAAALFVMIGAEPRTDWLRGVVALDPRGYVLTGTDVPVAV